jgi:DNA-binding PadR family transcriptional regulator
MAPKAPSSEPFKPLKPIIFDILVILARGDRHGWGIVKALESGPGQWRNILPGNLYRTLRDMTAKRLIEESDLRPDPDEDDERRRYYRLTDIGRTAAEAEAKRLRRTLTAARAADLLPADGPVDLPGREGGRP